MNIVYYCRHCKSYMGSLSAAQTTPEALGFTTLNPEEYAACIDYVARDDTTYVKTVCEYCESALAQHLDLQLSQTPIQ